MIFPNDDDINALINEIEDIKKAATVDKRVILEIAKVFILCIWNFWIC